MPREGRQVRPRTCGRPPRPRGRGVAAAPARAGAGNAGDRRACDGGSPCRHAQGDALPLQPNSIMQAIAKFMKKRGSKVRLHGLRHSHATHMLASGIHPKIASERLGHSKVGITLDLYSHVLPGMQEEAAIKVDTLISAALLHRQKSGR